MRLLPIHEANSQVTRTDSVSRGVLSREIQRIRRRLIRRRLVL